MMRIMVDRVEESRNTIVGWAWRLAVLFASVGLASGGEFALIKIPIGVSLQAVWTILSLIVLLGCAFLTWRVIQVRVTLVFSLIVLIWMSFSGVVIDQNGFRGAYVIATLCFILSISISLGGLAQERNLLSFYWAGICVMVIAPFVILCGMASDKRILQMTVAFATILILLHFELNRPDTYQYILGYLTITVASVFVYFDGARTASVTLMLAVLAYLFVGRSGGAMTRYVFTFSQIILCGWGAMLSHLSGQWTQGDQGVVVGTISINTNGRTTLWAGALDQAAQNPNPWGWLLGSGVGTSADSSLEVLGQSSPLNEYVRFFLDFGAIGLLGLLMLFIFMFTTMARLARTTGCRAIGVLGLVLVLGLALFSATENMMSYSWALIPVGTVLGLLISRTHSPSLNSSLTQQDGICQVK